MTALLVRLQHCPRGDPPIPVPYNPTFLNASHTSLLVSTDTIGKLQRRFLQKRPDLTGSLNLAYNGKPVQGHQSLGELGVKNGATFITFQRCLGG
uniref:Ubiquitin-like domain-containing protein n=1 Tax=Oncorhynchus tshawytscha TaxID=74940 RepID=A0A8C8CAF9_ONCTS